MRRRRKRQCQEGNNSDEISKEDCDTLFALMDLNNAQMGRIEKVKDPNIRAICIEQNPSLASSFSSIHRAEEEHRRQLSIQGLGRRNRVARGLVHNTQEDDSLALFQRRVREKGYTKEEIFHIFEEVNRWLPSRYDYIMAKAEGHLDASSNPFTRTKMYLNAEVAIGTGQLKGELFDQDSDDEFPEEGTWMRGNKRKKKRTYTVDEVEDIRKMANKWRKQKKQMEREAVDEEYDDLREHDEESLEEEEEMTLEEAKSLYIESRMMVDGHAICTENCSTDLISSVFSLYGCKDHGLIHICLADDGCIHDTPNLDKELVCIFSGVAVNKIFRGPRTYYNKSHNGLRSVAGDGIGIERKRRELSVMQQEYMKALSSFSSTPGDSVHLKQTQEEESGGDDYEEEEEIGNGKSTDDYIGNGSGLVEFVHVEDKEFNMAMVQSGRISGEDCVITSLAAALLVEKLFYHNDREMRRVSRGDSVTLDETARRMAMTASTRGLIEADRGSFLDNANVSSFETSRRTPFSVQGNKTPFTPGIAAAVADGAFLSPESRRDGTGPSVIPSEDFVITGDTFVTHDILREISAEGTGGSLNNSGMDASPLSGGGRAMDSYANLGTKQNALFSSSHRVMSTSPMNKGRLRLCASPSSRSFLAGHGGSPLVHSNSPRSMSRLDNETRYEINPYRNVQNKLRKWDIIMRTVDHPSNIVATPRYTGRGSTMEGSSSSLRSSSIGSGRVFTPKTPLAMSREVKEQEEILQSQAGVVMKKRKRGRNSLVRSSSEISELNNTQPSPFSENYHTTSITRGSRPGRSKKNEELYKEGMFQVYMPSSSDGGEEVDNGESFGGNDGLSASKHSGSFISKFTPASLTQLSKNRCSPKGSRQSPRGGVTHRASASPWLRKVLTSSAAKVHLLGLTSEDNRIQQKARPIEFHKNQYFLVKGEKRRVKNTNLKAMAMLKRSRQLQKIKKEQKMQRNKRARKKEEGNEGDGVGDEDRNNKCDIFESESNTQHDSEFKEMNNEEDNRIPDVDTEATDTVLMGSIADILIGKPSVSSIHRIVQSSDSLTDNNSAHTSINAVEKMSTTGKSKYVCTGDYSESFLSSSHYSESSDRMSSEHSKREGDNDEEVVSGYTRNGSFLQTPRHRNILRSKRIEDVRKSRRERKFHENLNRNGVRSEQRAIPNGCEDTEKTIEFRGRIERFIRWIDKKTLVFSSDMNQYKNSIRTVMKDLIFSSDKRNSMKIAYRIVSLVGAKDNVKTRSCRASRFLRQKSLLDRRSQKRQRQEKDQKKTKKSFSKYHKSLTLGAIDDTFGRQLLQHGIKVIPNNEEKMRKYSNEIYYLWRLLMTSSYAASLYNPKAQFDHFVLGVLYYLSDRDIVLCDKVVMAQDTWLKDSLPRRKRLCENYAGKLKKSEVARIIQKKTDLKMDMLTFSTPSRVYNTKFITNGITRVKNLVLHFNQETASHQILPANGSKESTRENQMGKSENGKKRTSIYEHIDGMLIKHYLSRNSMRTFIQLRNTNGNVRNAAREYHPRKRLFS